MPEDAPETADRPDGPVAAQDRLDSWKEIAAYLKRNVTTVRRWEKREGLPVHRHTHERRDTVYGYASEIDTWWHGRGDHLASTDAAERTASADDESSPTAAAPTNVLNGPGRSPSSRIAWALAAAFLLSTALLAGLLVIASRTGAELSEVRFAMFPPPQTAFGVVSVSPDGRQVAFTAAARDGKTLLWVRPLNATDARPLPETDGASSPFWSPASDALGFFAAGKLWIAGLAGGSPRVVCDAPDGHGGTWNRDGVIAFAPGGDGAVLRVPASGGTATPVTTVAHGEERGHLWPEFLPDGNHFLYVAEGYGNFRERHHLFVGALDGSERRHVFPLSSNAVYHHDGYLIFVRDRQLTAQPFDTDRLAVSGEPIILADKVHQHRELHRRADFSVSTNGVLVYRTMQSPASRLVWRDRSQARSPLVSTPAEFYEPMLSPDETRVAVGVFDAQLSKRFGYGIIGIRSDIWILNRSTGEGAQFTSDPGADWGPVWSPDGREIVFSSNRRGNLELYRKNATGEGPEELLLAANGGNPIAQSWSPDGEVLVYQVFDPKTDFDLWLLPMKGSDRTPVPLMRTEFREEQGQISPDGRWLAYTSNESGRSEVYVQGFPVQSDRRQISTNGGGDPRWRPDGKELFYVAADRQFMAVTVETGATFKHGAAVQLFDTGMPPRWYEARNLYDVSRDGGFLFMAPIEDDRSLPFTVVVNWAPNVRK